LLRVAKLALFVLILDFERYFLMQLTIGRLDADLIERETQRPSTYKHKASGSENTDIVKYGCKCEMLCSDEFFQSNSFPSKQSGANRVLPAIAHKTMTNRAVVFTMPNGLKKWA
jgi:hypothetical protein